VELLIIAIQQISPERKKVIIDQCLMHRVQVRNIPPVHKWINGELSIKQIKDVNIEDVLGRDPIQLDVTGIKQELEGKTVVITGAAGSIGSELARQIVQFKPERLILIDQAESALNDLNLELEDTPGSRPSGRCSATSPTPNGWASCSASTSPTLCSTRRPTSTCR
jgi:FlaA1/EpsC-like NDP-sugar epimerase